MKDKRVSENFLVLAIAVSMFLWGVSWPSNKVLSAYCSPANFIIYRYIVVLISLFPVLLFLKMDIRIKKEGFPYLLGSGALLALYSYFFFKGIKYGAAGAGGVLVTTMNPIMAYAVNIVSKKAMPSRNERIGLLLGLIAGCTLLQIWKSTDALFESGNLFFLSAAFTWAVMSKLTSRAISYGSSMSFSFWQYAVTLLCLLPLVNLPELKAAIHITEMKFWLNLFFSAAVVTSLATTVYFYATTRLGAEKASSYIFMVPLSAAVSSWMILDEKILIHTIAGGVLGILAVYAINKKTD